MSAEIKNEKGPPTRTWQNYNSRRNTLSAEIKSLSKPTDDDEAEQLIDEKGLLQQASESFREICESSENMVLQPSEGMAADR